MQTEYITIITDIYSTNFVSKFFHWMYPSGGGDEFIDSAALGILILWTTWFVSCIKIMHACIIVCAYIYKTKFMKYMY